MNMYADLSVGCAGIIWILGAFTKEKFLNSTSNRSAVILLVGVTILFLSGIPDGFSSISGASSANLFGFIGRMLGLVGCARVLFVRFPNV